MFDAVPVEYMPGEEPDGGNEVESPAGRVVTLVYAALRGIEAGVLVR